MANKIFVPPFAPKNMFKYNSGKIKKVNFIIEKKKFNKTKNKNYNISNGQWYKNFK